MEKLSKLIKSVTTEADILYFFANGVWPESTFYTVGELRARLSEAAKRGAETRKLKLSKKQRKGAE